MSDELAPQERRQPDPKPYKVARKSTARATSMFRQALADVFTQEDANNLARILFDKAMAGDVEAAKYLFDRQLGKPGVGTADKIADDVAADALEAAMLDRLSDAEKVQFLRLHDKMTRLALPAPRESADGPAAAQPDDGEDRPVPPQPAGLPRGGDDQQSP